MSESDCGTTQLTEHSHPYATCPACHDTEGNTVVTAENLDAHHRIAAARKPFPGIPFLCNCNPDTDYTCISCEIAAAHAAADEPPHGIVGMSRGLDGVVAEAHAWAKGDPHLMEKYISSRAAMHNPDWQTQANLESRIALLELKVAALEAPPHLDDAELRTDVYTPGGTTVTHLPTGITETVTDTEVPSAHKARQLAIRRIAERLRTR